jgi:hypothetical protein
MRPTNNQILHRKKKKKLNHNSKQNTIFNILHKADDASRGEKSKMIQTQI